MSFWVVCWVGEGNTPAVDVFAKQENAMACLNYMMSTGKTAIVKTVNVQIEKNEEENTETNVEAIKEEE